MTTTANEQETEARLKLKLKAVNSAANVLADRHRASVIGWAKGDRRRLVPLTAQRFSRSKVNHEQDLRVWQDILPSIYFDVFGSPVAVRDLPEFHLKEGINLYEIETLASSKLDASQDVPYRVALEALRGAHAAIETPTADREAALAA